MAIINGRRIQVPPSGITGQKLIQQVNPGPGRRPVIQQGMAFRPVQSGYTYKPEELYDKHGNPVKITTIPDRTKGVSPRNQITIRRMLPSYASKRISSTRRWLN